jgi:signal transduction histidine kinase
LAVVAVAAFLASTAYLQNIAYELGTSVESLRLAEEVQAELLVYQHAKTLEILAGSDAHAREAVEARQRLTHLVEWATGRASSGEERRLLGALRGSVQDFLSSTAGLGPGGPAARAETELLTTRFDDTFAKGQAVIQYDLDLAEVQRRHASVQRMAAFTAASIAAGLLLMLLLVGRTLRGALFVPLQRVSEAIRAYPRDRSKRAPEIGSAELQQIARTFNLVASDLQAERDNQLRFLGGLAHDLRNPLGALRNAFSLLRRDRLVNDEARFHRLLHAAGRSVDHLDTMLEDLLDLSRVELGRLSIVPESCDLRDVVRDTAALFDGTGATVQLDLPDAAVPAWCDPGRITQVLGNLVSNAIKYSPESGVVRIAARSEQRSAVVEVADSGIGIPKQELDSIFDPFQRSSATRGAFPGVGLGLFVSKQVVEAHRGQLTVDSAPGRGSTFRVSLPASGER